jgi:hypothetical protein
MRRTSRRGRGDGDARGRPLIIPALAVTGASYDMPGDEAAELLEGLERLEGALVAPLRDAEQAIRASRRAVFLVIRGSSGQISGGRLIPARDGR